MATITKLATRDRLKRRIGTSETSDDDLFDELLEVSTEIAVDLVGTEIRRETGVTLYPWGTPEDAVYLNLSRYPIESITSVKQAYTETAGDGWSSITALVETTDYLILEPGAGQEDNRGQLRRLHDKWLQRPGLIQVIGTFGFADPADVPAGAIAPPARLQEAICADALTRWQHRNTGGYGDAGVPDSMSELKPHPQLIETCKRLQRWIAR